MRTASPLRYPGGKWRIARFIDRLLRINSLVGREYVEPYAGGASLALTLLFQGSVSRVHLNDLDPAIYSFWWAALKRTEELVALVDQVPLTVDEWHRQRSIYAMGSKAERLALGFSTFYLNRTNHSGIMNGGLIGGKRQEGVWKMDARFNRQELRRRIETISKYGHAIRIYQHDAIEFVKKRPFSKNALIYLDPPYFKPGKALYLNAYAPSDHSAVKQLAEGLTSPWLISYDDVAEIRRLYDGHRSRRLTLLHSARTVHVGREVMFFSDSLKIPRLSIPRVITGAAYGD